MIPLHSSNDLQQFAGHAVAFSQKGNDQYFESCWCGDLNRLKFGVISQERTLGRVFKLLMA